MSLTTVINTKISFKRVLSDYKQLAKVGLSLSVVFSAIAGYLLAVEIINYQVLFLLGLGGFLMVAASNAFNQIIEKDTDALMKRTMNRPLPTGRMSKTSAFIFAITFTIIGLGILYSINPKSALFGAISIFLYTCAYTPMKPVSPLAVFVGALPGAIPFMLGWVAATNEFGIEPGVLFMIQFFWQFPHFWAIGWLMHDQYKAAGFKMLPSGARDQSTAFQTVFYTFWTVLISLLPAFYSTGSLILTFPSVVMVGVLGAFFLFYALRLMFLKDDKAARFLIRASILYITGIQLVYVLDKFLFQ